MDEKRLNDLAAKYGANPQVVDYFGKDTVLIDVDLFERMFKMCAAGFSSFDPVAFQILRELKKAPTLPAIHPVDAAIMMPGAKVLPLFTMKQLRAKAPLTKHAREKANGPAPTADTRQPWERGLDSFRPTEEERRFAEAVVGFWEFRGDWHAVQGKADRRYEQMLVTRFWASESSRSVFEPYRSLIEERTKGIEDPGLMSIAFISAGAYEAQDVEADREALTDIAVSEAESELVRFAIQFFRGTTEEPPNIE